MLILIIFLLGMMGLTLITTGTLMILDGLVYLGCYILTLGVFGVGLFAFGVLNL